MTASKVSFSAPGESNRNQMLKGGLSISNESWTGSPEGLENILIKKKGGEAVK